MFVFVGHLLLSEAAVSAPSAGEGLALSLPGATLTLAPRSGTAISRSGLVLTPILTGGVLRPHDSNALTRPVPASAVWCGGSAGLIISATMLQCVHWLQEFDPAIRYRTTTDFLPQRLATLTPVPTFSPSLADIR